MGDVNPFFLVYNYICLTFPWNIENISIPKCGTLGLFSLSICFAWFLLGVV